MTTCWKCSAPLGAGDRRCAACGADQVAAPKARLVIDFDDVVAPAPPLAPAYAAPEAAPVDEARVETGAMSAVEPDATARMPAPEPEADQTARMPPPRADLDETAAMPEPTAPPAAVAVADPVAARPAPVAIDVDPEPATVAEPARLLVDPVEPSPVALHGLVRSAVDARKLLWADIDGAQALLATIEASAQSAAGTVAGTVESHARLTRGPNYVAELRAVEAEIRNEIQVIGEREAAISSHEAEIARLKRNRVIMIAAIAACVLLFVIVVAAAL